MLFHGAPFDPGRRALLFGLIAAPLAGRAERAAPQASVPILCYHRFGPTAADVKNVKHVEPGIFTSFTNLTVHAPLPPRAVVLTVDDGHQSQFDVMMPRLQARGWPVTLFVYPSPSSFPSSTLPA